MRTGDVMMQTERQRQTDRLEDAMRLVLKMEEEAMSQARQVTFLETRKGKEMDSPPIASRKDAALSPVDPFETSDLQNSKKVSSH